jgi:cbb3-type cytochrome oxidase subunit 3
MVVEEIVNSSTETVTEAILELGRIGNWLQAIGVIVILWVLIQIINFIFNWKKRKDFHYLKNDLDRIEKKIDKLPKKK